MKKLLLFLAMGTSVMFGQTLTKVPSPGESYYGFEVVSGNYSIGTPGTGKTWDFQGLTLKPGGKISNILASATPYAQKFPQASLAVYIADSTGETYGFSGLVNNSKYMNYGSITRTGTGDVMELIYSDPTQSFVYPCSYGTSFTDNFQAEQRDSATQTVIFTMTGTLNFTADASGTLLTDFGTFNNVLRIYTKTDISYVSNGTPQNTTIHQYQFYSPSYSYPLVSVLVVGIDTLTVVYNPFYTSLTQAQLEEIKVFPTFVSQNLHLAIPERKQAEILIFNINGQEVFKTFVKNSRNTFDLSDLPAGMYFVEVRLEEHRKFFKMIKQ